MNNYCVYINSMDNNTIITLTNFCGKVIYWSSSGKIGFKGTKKSTSYSAQLVAEQVKNFIKKNKIKILKIFIRGFGYGRDSAIRVFSSNFFKIISITDISIISFNGCRSKKNRRV